MAKTSTVETTAYPELAAGVAEIAKIEISGNFRKTFNQERLAELAKNIKQVGVLEPILTRPLDSAEGTMVLVAGARRLEASKLAGLTTIPYRMLALDEAQANEVQALENLHREQLNPIEEAQAFKTLLDQGSYTPEDLAGRVNKSLSYVYRSIKLLELPENAQLHISSGDFTPAHGHKLLLLTPEQQAETIAWMENESEGGTSWPTVAALGQEIEYKHGRTLSGACFPTDKEFAGKPACSNCPHNAAAQSMLFDAQAEGQCLNGECFNEKEAQFDYELAQAQAEKYADMKYLGVQDWRYVYINSTNLKKFGKAGPIVEDSLAKRPEIKSALKKTPEKFGFGVLKGAHQVVLVLTDKELFDRVFPKKEDDGSGQETPEQKLARQKEEFFKRTLASALIREAIKAPAAPGMGMVAEVIAGIDGDYDVDKFLQEEFKLKNLDAKTLAKMGMPQLLKLGYLRHMLGYDYTEAVLEKNVLKPFSLKTAAIKAQSQKAAQPEWEKHLAEQEKAAEERKAAAAAAKAAKKAAPRQEEEETEEGDNE